MTVAVAALVAMAVLAGAGALPVAALVGGRFVAVPLAPLAGAVIAALAAAGEVSLGGSIVAWFTALAVAAGAVVLAIWVRWPSSRLWRPGREGMPAGTMIAGVVAAVGTVAAAGWSLVALRTPSVGFDARTIWMLHARWYLQGHAVSLAALRDSALSFAHTAYPPLVGGSVAVSWVVTGDHTDRFGVVVIALLNACAAVAAAWVLVDLSRRLGSGADPVRLGVVALVGALEAVALVLVAFGVAGPFATNGYADMLWAVAAVGAVGYGLVLPGHGSNLRTAAVFLAVAGLTKNEGYVTVMAIVAFMALRSALDSGIRGPGRWWRPLVAGLVAVAALGSWPALTRLLDAAPNAAAPGGRDGTDASRFHATVASMAPHLHVLLLALPVALVGALWLRRTRGTAGLGADGWTWAALVAGLAVVGFVYVTGPGNIELWLVTSTHRTTFYGALVAWWGLAIWSVIATAHAVRWRERPPCTSPRSSPAALGRPSATSRTGSPVPSTSPSGVSRASLDSSAPWPS